MAKKVIVCAFQVTPILVILDEDGKVEGEATALPFKMYPAKPFDVDATIRDIELIYEGQLNGDTKSH